MSSRGSPPPLALDKIAMMQLVQHATRRNTTQFRWDEPGNCAINIPSTVASKNEAAVIKTERKTVAVV
jgi:hypothetical protein